MNYESMGTFFELQHEHLEDEDMCLFLKALWIHNDPVKKPDDPYHLVVPGRPDLQKADKVLYALGYRKYSIDYLPKSAYGYDTTQITFRNTLATA